MYYYYYYYYYSNTDCELWVRCLELTYVGVGVGVGVCVDCCGYMLIADEYSCGDDEDDDDDVGSAFSVYLGGRQSSVIGREPLASSYRGRDTTAS